MPAATDRELKVLNAPLFWQSAVLNATHASGSFVLYFTSKKKAEIHVTTLMGSDCCIVTCKYVCVCGGGDARAHVMPGALSASE